MIPIQTIYVRGHEERSQPKPHTVYRIEIVTPVSSWQMWHRYSEFVELHSELTKVTGLEPPASLPSKHIFSFRKNDIKVVEERRDTLETYLRAIIASKDSQWRDARPFIDFLGVPVGKHGAIGSSSQFTFSSWIDEQSDLQILVRDIRADINKRNSLADMGDSSASHISNVQAKKKLLTLLDKLGVLAKGLETLGMQGMPQGELQRRSDMVARLQDDCEKLGKMVVAARQATRPLTSAVNHDTPASQVDRATLLSSPLGKSNRPITRVFGAPPQETEVTRPLDDTGLLQLQKKQMEQQDDQASQLTAILRRQRQLGIVISDEIHQQNELLDNLSVNADKATDKLNAAEKLRRRLG
ncbi:syntaxin [Hysterangium stoloniferum]|nr:syntaxin [Hysterangium stoloniferum]